MSRRFCGFAELVACRVVWKLQPQIQTLGDRMAAIERSNRRQETIMSDISEKATELDAKLAELNTVVSEATDRVATKLDADRAELESVREQLSEALAGNPDAAAALDRAIAGVDAAASSARAIGADPAEPVPSGDPIVGDGGDTTSGEPVPSTDPTDSGSNPVDSGDDSSDESGL